MLKARDLTSQSVEELEIRHQDLCKEIFDLLCELRLTKKVEKPHLISEKKRDRARVLTVLRQKKALKEDGEV